MDERKRLLEPPTLRWAEQRKRHGEVGLVLLRGRSRLEEQHDLRVQVRDALLAVRDGAREREPDPRIPAEDPGVALPRLAEDVEAPCPRAGVTNPGLVMPAERLLRRRPCEAAADDEELVVGQRTPERLEAGGAHGGLDVSVVPRPAPHGEVDRPAAGDQPRLLQAAEALAHLERAPRLPEPEVRDEALLRRLAQIQRRQR